MDGNEPDEKVENRVLTPRRWVAVLLFFFSLYLPILVFVILELAKNLKMEGKALLYVVFLITLHLGALGIFWSIQKAGNSNKPK